MRVWVCTDFPGFYPVGTSAVIVARDADRAAKLLADALEERGLGMTGRETLRLLLTSEEGAHILQDGEY